MRTTTTTALAVAATLVLAAPVAVADPSAGPDSSRKHVLSNLVGHDHHAGRVLWYDLSANVEHLDTADKVAEMVGKTADAGFDTIVLDVGNYTGFVAYDSAIAPHISQSRTYAGRTYPAGYDLLAEVIDAAHDRGVQVHANLNVFAQGATGTGEGPAFDNPEWQSVFYEGVRVAKAGAAAYPIAGTNVTRGADQLVMYTPEEYDVSPANQWGAEAAVVDGVVTELRDRVPDGAAPLPVPDDGVVLSGHGAARTWLLDHATVGAEIDWSNTQTRLVPAAEHDAQFATFVNPLRDDVREYAQSLFAEIVENYDVDGVVLDRARYASQYADFSDESRAAFEERIGEPVANWPEDIFEIVHTDTGQDIERGPLFQDWIEFRAAVVTDFVEDTQALVRELDPAVTYSIYAGAWYPLYWHEGVNWGSRNYQPDYDWASPTYGSTGYAETLDFFMAGTYFEDVTREEAVASGQPADWYSVEGSAEIAMEATDFATFVYGSLFVLQYEGDEERFRRAMQMAMDRTHGLMIFDLVYLEMYDWWHVVADVLDGAGASPHTNQGFLNLVRR
jgi:uncharacterized lipoprotein YddW (UPF0748 family)